MLFGLAVVMTTSLHTKKQKKHYDDWIEKGYDDVKIVKF